MPRTVHLKAPSRDINSVSVDGVEYEVKRGFVTVAATHAEDLLAAPHFFKRADDEPDEEDDTADAGPSFATMSKAELIDFVRARGENADRKMSKEQLVDLANSVKDKPEV